MTPRTTKGGGVHAPPMGMVHYSVASRMRRCRDVVEFPPLPPPRWKLIRMRRDRVEHLAESLG